MLPSCFSLIFFKATLVIYTSPLCALGSSCSRGLPLVWGAPVNPIFRPSGMCMRAGPRCWLVLVSSIGYFVKKKHLVFAWNIIYVLGQPTTLLCFFQKNSSSFREIQQEEEKNLAYKDKAVIIKITGAFLKITTSEVASIPLVGFGD